MIDTMQSDHTLVNQITLSLTTWQIVVVRYLEIKGDIGIDNTVWHFWLFNPRINLVFK